jgi:hypothetical protein
MACRAGGQMVSASPMVCVDVVVEVYAVMV